MPATRVSETLLADRALAGIHFTGSTEVFQSLWKRVGENLTGYASYPRLVGETGGKDFIVAHPSADVEALATAIVRGAYEYQGQKCSAASRAYVPAALWPRVRQRVLDMLAEVKMGDPVDSRNFMGAVIDRKAFDKIKSYIEAAKQAPGVQVIFGGRCDDTDGYFVEPTLLETTDPAYRTMCDEIFGPVLSVYPYPEARWKETLALVDETSPYALTGAVFAQDRQAVDEAQRALRLVHRLPILREDRAGERVGRRFVHERERLLPAGLGVGVDREHRPEDLVAHRAVGRVRGLEQGWLDEVTVRVVAAAPEDHLDARSLLRRLDVALDLVERLPVDHGAHEVPGVDRIAHLHLGEHVEHALTYSGPKRAGHVGARSGAALLPLVLVRPAHDRRREGVDVGARVRDDEVFPARLAHEARIAGVARQILADALPERLEH